MVATHRIINGTSDITVDELLADADAAPALLQKNDVVYRLSREEKAKDIWYGYDPDRVRQMLDEMEQTGGLQDGIDVDKWIAEIYEARELGSRS